MSKFQIDNDTFRTTLAIIIFIGIILIFTIIPATSAERAKAYKQIQSNDVYEERTEDPFSRKKILIIAKRDNYVKFRTEDDKEQAYHISEFHRLYKKYKEDDQE